MVVMGGKEGGYFGKVEVEKGEEVSDVMIRVIAID